MASITRSLLSRLAPSGPSVRLRGCNSTPTTLAPTSSLRVAEPRAALQTPVEYEQRRPDSWAICKTSPVRNGNATKDEKMKMLTNYLLLPLAPNGKRLGVAELAEDWKVGRNYFAGLVKETLLHDEVKDNLGLLENGGL